MELTMTIVLVGIVLGAVQLAAGIVIGRCWPAGRGRSRQDELLSPGNLEKFGGRLYRLVAAVADDVGEHKSEISRANDELSSVQASGEASLTEVVLGTIAKVMQINERLQDRLSTAEDRLQDQARRMESHIAEARTDPLTGLPNRRAFDDALVRRIAEWQRKGAIFCLMMADVDHFKALNDRHGHPAGDGVLRDIAELLRHNVREMDMVARVGGEEFAVILPSTNSRDARRMAERVRTAVASTTFRFDELELHVTVSLGLAIVQIGDDPVSLLGRADEALYTSKRSGRNCGHFHNGRRCEKILFGSKARAEQSDVSLTDAEDVKGRQLASCQPPSPDDLDDSQLAALCEDLRNRLTEIADDPPDQGG